MSDRHKGLYDIAIVGAGILGSMAAFHAHQQGLKVLLVEAGSKANHATVRNFGQVIPSGQQLGVWREYGQRSTAIYKQLATRIDAPVRCHGTTYIAHDHEQATLLAEMAFINKHQAYDSELLSCAAVCEKQPSLKPDQVSLALHYPQEISVDSPEFMARFHRYLAKLSDVTVCFNTPVIDIGGDINQYRIVSDQGRTFHAAQLLFCCGHLSLPLLAPFYQNEPLQLVKLQMMASHRLPAGFIRGNVLGGLSIRRCDAFKACPSYTSLKQTKEQGILELGFRVLHTRTFVKLI